MKVKVFVMKRRCPSCCCFFFFCYKEEIRATEILREQEYKCQLNYNLFTRDVHVINLSVIAINKADIIGINFLIEYDSSSMVSGLNNPINSRP